MKYYLLTGILLFTQLLKAQSVTVNHFPAVTVEMLQTKTYPVQPDAAAVVLAESGFTRLMDDNEESFMLEFTLHRRIHILKSSAYDIANITEELYQFDDVADKITDIKAVTYNLENGKVTAVKLNTRSGVFTERISPRKVIKKFALPNVREGSVIDVEYSIRTTYLFSLRPWDFQGDYPVLWSSYKVALPDFLDYILLSQGLLPYTAKTEKLRNDNFSLQYDKEVYGGKIIKERVDLVANVVEVEWVMENLPAFNPEPFTSSPYNYINRLRFQLAGYKPPLTQRTVTPEWPEYMKTQLAAIKLDEEVGKTAEWWPPAIREYLKGAATETEIAKAVFNYVRTNFSIKPAYKNGLRTNLKKIAEDKAGTPFEINLVLVAMLRHIGLKADPVLLSSRSNGRLTEAYPVDGELDYLIVRVTSDGDDWLLDASKPWLGFGKLDTECYNGQARVMNPEATVLNLKPAQLTEITESVIDWKLDPGTAQYKVNVQHHFGYYASGKMRETIRKGGQEALRKELSDAYSGFRPVGEIRLEQAAINELPVKALYTLEPDGGGEATIYIQPVLNWEFNQNPFKSSERQYAVELPYKISQLYTTTLEIPDTYMLDELPASRKITLNDKNDAVFDYAVKKEGNTVTITCLLEINKTVFMKEEYKGLRDFFSAFTGLTGVPLVLKKK